MLYTPLNSATGRPYDAEPPAPRLWHPPAQSPAPSQLVENVARAVREDASVTWLTILQVGPNCSASKIWLAAGTVAQFNAGMSFRYRVIGAASLDAVRQGLDWLQGRPDCLLIYGLPKAPGVLAEDGFSVDAIRRRLENLDRPPTRHVVIDVDNIPAFPGRSIEETAQLARDALLPEQFRGVACIVQISASSGHPSKGGRIGLHFFFIAADPFELQRLRDGLRAWLASPEYAAALEAYCASCGTAFEDVKRQADGKIVGLDVATLHPVQAIYVASPKIEAGAPADPYAGRRVFCLDGREHVDVTPILAAPRARVTTGAFAPNLTAVETPDHALVAAFIAESGCYRRGAMTPWNRRLSREQWLARPRIMRELGFTAKTAWTVHSADYDGDNFEVDTREAAEWAASGGSIGKGTFIAIVKHAAKGAARADVIEALERLGGDGPQDPTKVFVDIPAPPQLLPGQTAPQAQSANASAARFEPRPFVWRDPAAIPPRRWLYGRRLIRGYVSGTVAPGGLGKSSLVIVDALAMVTGLPLLRYAPEAPLKVWYWCGEDPLEEIERRVAAVCKHYGIGSQQIGDRLFLDSGRAVEIVIATAARTGVVVNGAAIRALAEALTRNKIDVLVLDPFVSTHRVSENDNTAIDAIVKSLAKVADIAGCAVEIVHHVRKLGGAEATAEDARGAKALVDAARSVRVLNRMSEAEADKAGVDDRRRFFRSDRDKENLSPPGETDWFELISVPLGNGAPGLAGDDVGVVRRWTWPDAFAGVEVDDLRRVQERLASGDRAENSQADNWAGLVVAEVLGLDASDKAARARIKELLAAWIKSGVLRIESRHDSRAGRERKFVIAGRAV